jgi:hypothetical protein
MYRANRPNSNHYTAQDLHPSSESPFCDLQIKLFGNFGRLDDGPKDDGLKNKGQACSTEMEARPKAMQVGQKTAEGMLSIQPMGGSRLDGI